MGRPTKLTAELQEALCELLSEGRFFEHACAEVGVHKDTVNGWLRAAETDEGTDAERAFSAACAQARSQGERVYLDNIRRKSEEHGSDHRPGDWKADQWLLQVLNPKRYRETTRHEVTGADGGAVKMSGVLLLPAEDDDGGAKHAKAHVPETSAAPVGKIEFPPEEE